MKSILTKNKKSAGLCIAGTHSGCGKTTVTLGIMAALILLIRGAIDVLREWIPIIWTA